MVADSLFVCALVSSEGEIQPQSNPRNLTMSNNGGGVAVAVAVEAVAERDACGFFLLGFEIRD
jgi:hypothetical protein